MIKKEFYIVQGGCRGFIDETNIYFLENTLEGLVKEYHLEAIENIKDGFEEDAEGYIEEFGVGGTVYKSKIGEVGVVVNDEEDAFIIVEVTEKNREIIKLVDENENIRFMWEVEDVFGLEYKEGDVVVDFR